MIILSLISLYLSIGLSISFIYVMLLFLSKGETTPPTSILVCILLWPEIVSLFISNINK